VTAGGQTTRYLLDDGTQARGSDNAVRVSLDDVAAIVPNYTNTLPPGLFAAIAERETNLAINEIDDDLNDDGSVYGTTYGIYQLSRAEAAKALVLSASAKPTLLCELDTATEVAAATFQRLADAIWTAGGGESFDPRAVDVSFWAFVGLAHNLGLGVEVNASGKKRAIAIVQTLINAGGGWSEAWDSLKANPLFGLTTQIQTRNGPYGDRIIQLVQQYPFASADTTEDPTAGVSAYGWRKVIAVAVIVILALVIIGVVFNVKPSKVVADLAG